MCVGLERKLEVATCFVCRVPAESFPLSFLEFVSQMGGRGLHWTHEMVAHALFQQYRHDGFMC